jgi:hypothetical protein
MVDRLNCATTFILLFSVAVPGRLVQSIDSVPVPQLEVAAAEQESSGHELLR